MTATTFLIIALTHSIALSFGGPPKINAKSEKTFKKSMEKVQESLPEDKQALFLDAVQTLMFSKINVFGTDAQLNPEKMQEKMMATLDGKTGLEIIAEAALIDKQRNEAAKIKALKENEAKKNKALKEIEDLELKKKLAEQAKPQLLKFKVLSSNFYKKEQPVLGTVPIIELTVLNGTTTPISRAYFSGTLQSPGRSVPWLTDEFDYRISGGIEPGEKSTWSILLYQEIKWRVTEIPEDAVLKLEVTRLDDPDGNAIGSTSQFTKNDQQRLDELKMKYKE